MFSVSQIDFILKNNGHRFTLIHTDDFLAFFESLSLCVSFVMIMRKRNSEIHAQEANRDNLFMGYFLQENPGLTYTQIEIFQISP